MPFCEESSTRLLPVPYPPAPQVGPRMAVWLAGLLGHLQTVMTKLSSICLKDMFENNINNNIIIIIIIRCGYMLGVPKWGRWGQPPWDGACWPLKHAPPRHGLPTLVMLVKRYTYGYPPNLAPRVPPFKASHALSFADSCVKLSLFCHSFVSRSLTRCAYEMKWIVFKPCCYSFMAYTACQIWRKLVNSF